MRPSTSELLREPLIVNHIKNMIKRLETKQFDDDLDSTLVIRNDRVEIANALFVFYFVQNRLLASINVFIVEVLKYL